MQPDIETIKNVAPGVIGAGLAMWRSESTTWPKRLLAFVIGAVVSHYGGNWLSEYLGIKGAASDALKLGLGLFGMRLVEVLELQIPAAFRAARVKIIGNDPESQKGDL
jgi:uncharacterized membrane protein YadS